MTYDKQKLKAKALKYCSENDTTISRELGFGTQGVVYKTGHNTAIKVYDLKDGFDRELSVYQRLKERDIRSIRGMNIPRLVKWDNSLLVLEMSIVHVPCILDFGGTYLDSPPDHLDRNDYWKQEKAEEFDSNWKEAQAVVAELEYRAGIWLADINVGNIKFPEK